MLNPIFIQEVKKLFQAFKKELKKCRQRPSTKAVHNLRIRVRRILTSLEVIQHLQPEIKGSAFGRASRQLMRTSGRLRNIHVQILWIEKFFPRIGPGLNEFLKILARRQKRVQQKFLKQARAFNVKSSRKLLKNIKLQAAEPAAEPLFIAHGRLLLKQQYQALAAFELKIREPKNIDALHQFRLAFKSYRYSMEIIGPLVASAVTTELIASMHQFQTILGELHDLDILDFDLVRFSKAKKRTKYEINDLKRARRKLRKIRQENFVNFLPAQQMAMAAFHPDKLWTELENQDEQPLSGEITSANLPKD